MGAKLVYFLANNGLFYLTAYTTTITEYDEALVRRLIEKVTIHEDKFTVEFKSELTVDVEE